jgi:hypothetical protein
MREFFLILLFSKSMMLTSDGIDVLNQWTQVPLKERIEAITPGASIYVDVSQYVDSESSIEYLDTIFPPGTVRARLVHADGQETVLSNGSAYSFSSNDVYLILNNEQGVPTSSEISELFLISDKKLINTYLIWNNCKK